MVRTIKEPSVITAHVERKQYSYEKNGTTLAFTLRQDVPSEMKDFKQMMEIAVKEIEADLERQKNRI